MIPDRRRPAATPRNQGGALAQDRTWALANTPEGLQAQMQQAQKEIQKRGGNAPNWQQRLTQIQGAMNGSAPGVSGSGTPYDAAAGQIAGAAGNLAGYIGNQGAFNPGDFEQQRQGAYDAVMNQFNRTMDPQFQQQEQRFFDRAQRYGWDPQSQDTANAFRDQIANPQNAARLNAMDQAYGAGLNAQNQAWGQSYQQFMAPAQQFSALSGAFGGVGAMQGQREQMGFQGQQNALDRAQQQSLANQQANLQKYLQQHQRGGGGGGGGGLSLQDQMSLQNNAFYNNMALLALQNGQQAPGPSVGSGFANGIGAGVGAGIAAGLTR